MAAQYRQVSNGTSVIAYQLAKAVRQLSRIAVQATSSATSKLEADSEPKHVTATANRLETFANGNANS